MKTFAAVLFTSFLAAAAAAAPSKAPARPLVGTYDAATVTRLCDEGIAGAKAALARMEAREGGQGFFDEWNRLQIGIEDVVNPIYLMGSVHPDKSVRDAADPCLTKYTTLSTEIFQSEKLFARLQATRAATPHQAKLRKDLVEGFEDTGVSLPPDRRRRAKEIFDRLEVLRQDYDKSVRDDPTKVVMTPAEMEGMPEAYVKAQKTNAEGNYVLGLEYPAYVPFMAGAKSEAARKRYYVAKLSEGGEANLARLDEIFLLRKELAALYDLPSFAAYSLRRKMVKKPETVEAFLADVKTAVAEGERRELDELRAAKAKAGGQSAAESGFGRWDLFYWQERVRQARYAIDQEALRRYFPTDKAIAFTLLVSQRLYGVKFTERKVPVWHPEVRYFDVTDARTGAFLSGFYLDLFPREGKYGHAAAFPIRGASLRAKRTPISTLVTNFNRTGLDHEEMETLMHEFGHVLHGVLSRTDYVTHAGTSTPTDFVEAPSQMYEEWVRQEEPLALFAQVCPSCPRLTHDDIERLRAARRFGKGILYARQWLYAAFDMALATNPQPSLEVWKRMESATPMGYVEGTRFPASFSHIASNYAAGYYGYMWSEVLARDMLSQFSKDMLDPKVGRRYRDTILAQGGQVEPADMVRKFLGRAPSSKAFFAEIGGGP
ncbi:MAG: Zn-dependent oligopeptidase [Betaproteobacteria bacterium]|nr:Zn-dependent oligopeptidase [Betaproteobacteria bacterium]